MRRKEKENDPAETEKGVRNTQRRTPVHDVSEDSIRRTQNGKGSEGDVRRVKDGSIPEDDVRRVSHCDCIESGIRRAQNCDFPDCEFISEEDFLCRMAEDDPVLWSAVMQGDGAVPPYYPALTRRKEETEENPSLLSDKSKGGSARFFGKGKRKRNEKKVNKQKKKGNAAQKKETASHDGISALHEGPSALYNGSSVLSDGTSTPHTEASATVPTAKGTRIMRSARTPSLLPLLLFVVGAIGYPIIELLWRGKTHYSMALAGGVCLVLIGLISSLPLGVISRSVLCALSITAVELFFGLFFNRLLHLAVWDYSRLPYSFIGQICLGYSLLWFALSMPLTALLSPLCRRMSKA